MKILILQPDLRIGGIEKSLINFINTFKEGNQIDLFLLWPQGEFFNSLDKKAVNIIDGSAVVKKYNSIKRKAATLLNIKSFYNVYKPLFNKQYDVAIVYSGLNLNLMNIMLNCVNAKQKIAFLHGDPKCARKIPLKRILKADKVICVSNSCKERLTVMWPKKADKVFALYNLQDYEDIIEKAKQEAPEMNYSGKKFVFVARFSEEKGHLRLLSVIKKLVDGGLNGFKFYFVGDGPLFEQVKKQVEHLRLNDYVVLLGKKANPYSYIKRADFLVLVSYNEAAPMVYGESIILNVPIISTETVSAKELVKSSGLVCGNSESGIYNALKDVIGGSIKLETSKQDIYKKENYKNDFYSIINQTKKVGDK